MSHSCQSPNSASRSQARLSPASLPGETQKVASEGLGIIFHIWSVYSIVVVSKAAGQATQRKHTLRK